MRGFQFKAPILPVRWRRPAGIALSLVAHVAALAFLVWPRAAPLHLPPYDGPIYLTIEPRPLLKNETPRPLRAPLLAPDQTRAPGGATNAPPLPFPPRDDDVAAPRMISPDAAAAAQAQGVDPWRVRPETAQDRLAQALRNSAPGCAMLRGQMNTLERANCTQRLAQRLDTAVPIYGSGDRERDARFAQEGARALAEYEARRRPLSGGSGVVGPGDCPGSNFGTGCAGALLPDVAGVDMRQGATTTHNGGQRSDRQQSPGN